MVSRARRRRAARAAARASRRSRCSRAATSPASIRARLAGEETPPFRYRDKGNLATIGRAAAVADIKGLRLSGFIAWVTWLVVHLWYLVGFQNRLIVLVRWSFSFLTHGRGARLITCDETAHDGGGAMTYVPAGDRYDEMIYNRCGRSGLKLPAISLGLWQNFGHERPLETSRAILRRAFDLGITHFDLANNYGPPYGSAEEVFGAGAARGPRARTATSS